MDTDLFLYGADVLVGLETVPGTAVCRERLFLPPASVADVCQCLQTFSAVTAGKAGCCRHLVGGSQGCR